MAIQKFPEPTTPKQLQSFLGLTGYFRKFIPAYAMIAKPLSDLLRKNMPYTFEAEQRQAFGKLKELLCSEPVLNIFHRGCETELYTDASKHGYGACLMQKSVTDGKLHPIFYMSKKTTPAEEKYTSYELEVLAIIQAVKKFRIYLIGNEFKIITDCSAFQKTMDKKDLTTRVARWALLLEEYSYKLEHRKGNRMLHVDALSRYPIIMMMSEEKDGMTVRIRKAQQGDEYLNSIRKILEKEEYEDYFMKKEVLSSRRMEKNYWLFPRACRRKL